MRKKIHLLQSLIILCSIFCGLPSTKAQNLNAGDVIIIGLAADSPDEFSWVPLVDLPAGEKVYFTNAAFNTLDNDFCGTGDSDDFLLLYIAPAGGITAGTVFTVSTSLGADYSFQAGTKFGDENIAINFTTTGDACTVFQSSDAIGVNFGNTNFTPIFSVTSRTTNWEANTGNCASNSDRHNLVSGLTDGINAVAAGGNFGQDVENDNIRYEGSTTGDRETILAAVANVANWGNQNNTPAAGYSRNGAMTGPGGFTVMESNPVELIAFEAKSHADRVILNWTTSSELNNKGFELEKSSNSTNWEKLAFVKGAGTTIEAQDYSYTDHTIASGMNYYRLKQVDIDGQFEYSQILAIQLAAKSNFNVFPTLATNILNVSMEGTATLRIINLEGQILKQFSLSDSAVLDISDLAEGMYLLSMESGEKMESVRFVKQ